MNRTTKRLVTLGSSASDRPYPTKPANNPISAPASGNRYILVTMSLISIVVDGPCRKVGIIVKNETTATNGLNTKD